MIKAVIFDFGKVISHAPNSTVIPDIAEAFGVMEEEVGKAMKLYMQDFRTGKINEDIFWQKFADLFGKPVPANKYDLWRKSFKENLEIYPEMLEFVRDLKAKGFKTAVVSNNIKPFVEISRERHGYDDFDAVINSCEVGLSKPDPKIFELALKKLDVKPEEAIFVDDKEANLESAKKLGIEVLLAVSPSQVRSDLKRILNF